MEQHVRMENEIVEKTLDNNFWDAVYDTNSQTFYFRHRDISKDNILN